TDVVERREGLAPKKIDAAQIKHELFGQGGVALNVAAQFAAVERIAITHHGNRCAGRTRLANSESRPAIVLQFFHGPRVRAVRPHGADGSHRKTRDSRCRGAVFSGRTAGASERRNVDAVGLVRRRGPQPHLRVVGIAWWVWTAENSQQ